VDLKWVCDEQRTKSLETKEWVVERGLAGWVRREASEVELGVRRSRWKRECPGLKRILSKEKAEGWEGRLRDGIFCWWWRS